MRIARANAIPETAFVISLALTVLYGALQMAIIGFNQLSADGATFVGNHATVAYYSAPTAANKSYAQQVGQNAFVHASGQYSSPYDSNGTYEVDYNNPAAGQAGLGYGTVVSSFFPSSLLTQSKTIEPSQTSTSMTTPLGVCTTALLNIGPSAINSAQGTAVGLLQDSGLYATAQDQAQQNGQKLFKLVQDSKGSQALTLDTTVVGTQVQTLTEIQAELAVITADLKLLSGPFDPINGTTTGVSGSLDTTLGPLGATVTQDVIVGINKKLDDRVRKAYNAALNGTLTSDLLPTATGLPADVDATVSSLPPPIPMLVAPVLSTLESQVTTSVTTTGAFLNATSWSAAGSGGGTLGSEVSGLQTTLQQLPSPVGGLFSPDGPLMGLSALEATLKNVDSQAPVSCPS